MTIFLNLALLIIGTTATLAAFGGKTWREGSEPIVERITSRGWASLMCLVLALALGVVKEIRTQEHDTNTEQAARDAKADAEKKQSELKTDLAAAKGREDLANQHIDDLKLIDKLTQDRLGETKATLNDVRDNLITTRIDLSQQSAANLVAAFANRDLIVRDIMLFLPMTERARRSDKFREAFLPRFDSPGCDDHLTVEVDIMTDEFNLERLVYEQGDKSTFHKRFLDPIPKVDALLTYRNEDEIYVLATGKDQDRSKAPKLDLNPHYAYNLQLRVADQSISAAKLYRLFASPKSRPFVIQASWPAPVKAYPLSCVEQVRKYFRVAFDKAALLLVFDDKQNETVAFRLRSLPPYSTMDVGGGAGLNILTVPFVTYSTPVFQAGDNTFDMTKDWPAQKPKTAPH